MLPIAKQNDGCKEVKAALQHLMARRAYTEQHIEEIRASYSLSAWSPSPVPKAKSNSFRRLETGTAKIVEAQKELETIDRDIGGYIRVLSDHRAEIRDADSKIQLMKMRYLQRMEWEDVAFRLFGDNKDYAARHRSYRRRVFRLHDQACAAIWDNWQSVTNSLPQAERPTRDTRVMQYNG